MKIDVTSICLVITFVYVGILYAIPASVRSLPRDNLLHIKYRLLAAFFGTVICVVITTLWFPLRISSWLILSKLLGFEWKLFFSSLLISGGLMTIFYLGPLICYLMYVGVSTNYLVLDNGVCKKKMKTDSIWSVVVKQYRRQRIGSDGVIIFRNFFFAPISEEVVFRAAIILAQFSIIWIRINSEIGTHSDNVLIDEIMSQDFDMSLISKIMRFKYIMYSKTQWTLPNNLDFSTLITIIVNLWSFQNISPSFKVAMGCPLWFAVAHMHHMYEKLRRGEPWQNVILATLLQLTYTTVFGAIAAILFMRTGSLFSSIFSHIICNFVGLPDTGFMYAPPPHTISSPINKSYNKGLHHPNNTEYSCLYPYKTLLTALHILGLVLFCGLLYPWTESLSESSIYWIPPMNGTN